MKNKQIMGWIVGLLAIVFLLPACDNDDKYEQISFNTLPSQSQAFVSTYFPGSTPVQVEQKGKGNNREYEVVLTGGYEVDFDHTGLWKEVDAPDPMPLPNPGFILEPIRNYVGVNFIGQEINSISREKNGYFDVELTGGQDLVFDSTGAFVRLDR